MHNKPPNEMHDSRPPARRRQRRPDRAGTTVPAQDSDDADRKRELARLRQRKKRKLDSNCFERVKISYSPLVTEALYWQAIDAAMTETEATAASTDKAKVAEGLAGVHEQWAARYLKERDSA